MEVMDSQCRPWARGMRFLPVAIALSLLLSNAWATGPTAPFNIPAMNVREALIAFQAQSPIDIFFYGRGESINGISTHPVVGEFEPADALAKMLEGTGLVYEAVQLDTGEVLKIHESAGQTGSAEDERFLKLHAAEQQPFGSGTQLPQEVVVTGSLIRGLDSITAPIVIVNQKEKKQAAYATVQDVLRTLPLNFGGGANEDFSSNQNFNRGSSINLRGLGVGATLVLVNGRRQPASSVQGDFIDVSTIPWSAVERIEVLADGASALYGSDAIAGVVNIIMRDNLSGFSETQARFGATPGGADERLFAQSFAHHWDGGKWLLTYQYSERTTLAAADRTYSASADKRPLGGSDLRSFWSNPGNILDSLTLRPVFAIPDGQDGRSLEPGDLMPDAINLYDQMTGRDLLPNKKAHGAFFTGSQKIGDYVTIFTEERYHHRQMSITDRAYDQLMAVPSTNPFFVDPFGGSPFVIVAYNFFNELGPIQESGEITTYTGTLGMKANIGTQWQATLSGHYGKERVRWKAYNLADSTVISEKLADTDPATAFNPFGSGSNTNPATLDAIRYTQFARAESDIKTINFVADGPLPDLRAGTPRLAAGLDQRTESLFRENSQARTITTSGNYERKITAAFAELSLPLVSRLNLSLAARYETYSDFGDAFNPKIGLRWTATDSVRFRGSWGTSFRAPTLVDLYDKSGDAAVLFPLADPHSANGFSLVLVEQGSNPGLHEETAKTWTAGIDLSSALMPGLTLSSTYYVIDYGNRVFHYPPTLALETALADEIWSPLVRRDPPRSEIERICRSPTFLGSSMECLASSPDVILDIRLRNLSSTTAKGIDMELKQALRTNYGSFDFGLNGSYMLSLEQAVISTEPAVDSVATALNPPRLRLRWTTDWSRHGLNQPGLGLGLAADYLSPFRDDYSAIATHIPAAITFDLQLSYRMEKSDAWLGGVEVTLNAVNVFDRNPPFVNREEGYDPNNTKPYGRVISLTVQKSW